EVRCQPLHSLPRISRCTGRTRRVGLAGMQDLAIEVSIMLRRSFLLTLCVMISMIILPVLAPAHGDKPDANVRPTPLPFEPTEELLHPGEFSNLVLHGIEIAAPHFTAAHAPVNQTTATTAEAA